MSGGSSRRRGAGVRADDDIIGALGGVGLTYFVFTPHGFEHPWHWVIAATGGLIGLVGVRVYAEPDHFVGRWRRLRRQASDPSKRAKRSKPTGSA
jgi:hypothetical protein